MECPSIRSWWRSICAELLWDARTLQTAFDEVKAVPAEIAAKSRPAAINDRRYSMSVRANFPNKNGWDVGALALGPATG